MVDITRRSCLKLFSITGLSTLIPTLSSASLIPEPSQSSLAPENNAMPKNLGSVPDIDINLSQIKAQTPAEDYMLVKSTNTATHTSTLRYIYPGVVHREGHAYDLNAIFTNDDGSLTIEAGKSVYRKLKPMQHLADRLNPPVQISKSGHVRVTPDSVSSDSQKPEAILRSVFS